MSEPPPERPYAIPELTRALRAFASHRGAPGSDHDRYFAPLVDALRSARDAVAADGVAPWRAAARVDAEAIANAVRATCAALAEERSAGAAPARRALEAELVELAEPLFAALADVGTAARALAAAPEAARPAAWNAWTAAFGRAFAAADACWEASLPALADPRGGVGRLWRSLLRQRGVRGAGP
ncbi:hypothetical protein tb265_31680 [Gemmatimonadetes bacterium T265]|nr:hypothetical protein tb265_31680 [Gemmatimonadetes bacterium T265]